MLERKHYGELRRRIVRWAMRPLFRASNESLSSATGLPAGEDIHRILVCRPNHRLGNLLLLTPLVIELESTFPHARIDIVLAGEHGAELFRTFTRIGRIYTLSRRMVRHPVAVVRTVLEIRRTRYDLAIDPCEASQSGHLLLAMAGARHAIGIPRGQSGREGSALLDRAPTHMAQWPVFLLRRRLAPQSMQPGTDYPAMDIQLSTEERQCARTTLERALHSEGRSRVIGVFAAATGAKGYDVDWWQRFIRVVGARHPDAAFVEIVPADGQPRLAVAGLPSFGSPSPREVAAVIANMTCFVSADCGVMHLASAAGVPTIGLFKASDLPKYAPYGHGSRALDTRGKSPEAIAETASTLIAAFPLAVPAGSCDHPRPDTAAMPPPAAASPGLHGH